MTNPSGNSHTIWLSDFGGGVWKWPVTLDFTSGTDYFFRPLESLESNIIQIMTDHKGDRWYYLARGIKRGLENHLKMICHYVYVKNKGNILCVLRVCTSNLYAYTNSNLRTGCSVQSKTKLSPVGDS